MWFFLSLSTAALVSVADALAKKFLQTRRPATVALIRSGWSSMLLLCTLPWALAPSQPARFWTPVMMALPLEVAAALAFNSALQSAPLSVVIPYMAFTPVFLVLEGWIFLHEKISVPGGAGIACVAAGAALLQAPILKTGDNHWKSLVPREKGPLLMLMVAFLYSLTSILAKKALDVSSPLYFCGTYFPLIAMGLLPFQFASGDGARPLVNWPGTFLLIGALDASALIAQFIAFQRAEVAYVMALKRLSLLLSVMWGWIFFREQKSWTRLGGAVLMALGAALIALR